MTDTASLIHDWNLDDGASKPSVVLLNDETLRDGLQSPSVRVPSIEQKLDIVHQLSGAGVNSVNLGLPAAGESVVRDIARLAREIRDSSLPIRPNCAVRMLVGDVRLVAGLAQRSGVAIECGCFIGASAIRQHVDGWTADELLYRTDETIRLAVAEGLEVMFVAEDATRAEPEMLARLFATAIRAGAARICVADTVGHATPGGARAVVRFARRAIDDAGGVQVGIDWHGHRDRDLATINSIAALEAGASRVHGTILGIGERVGNTPLDLLMVNLVLLGWIERDLTPLAALVQAVADATGRPIPGNYPVFGRDAFRTASGIHAATMGKAIAREEPALLDALHSGVPASLIGRAQHVDIGPMSGRSNVRYWLTTRGMRADDELVERLVRRAKASATVLTEQEILAEVEAAVLER